jgi:hypothetical protein
MIDVAAHRKILPPASLSLQASSLPRTPAVVMMGLFGGVGWLADLPVAPARDIQARFSTSGAVGHFQSGQPGVVLTLEGACCRL